ncbi:cysteine synthase A [Candidatus Falkowbacteria bacterium]|jgi:S-sulfo-L-cysteine synthase (O-acetyl-L-serine-dependent)|nr:cysteine synthase A [Candidatus Falkowbacteria bacterium]MBT4432816.1 cysteine synthase A [Candidatus Falkowbacteria bacterium]
MKNYTLLSSIGNTPLIELKNINKNSKVKIFAKFEGANPGGSIKDRTALFMIEAAEKSGELKKGKIILEPTSGNTGISLAMIGAAKGYKVKLIMPECVSIERRRTLEAFGAEAVLTPGKFRTDGSIKKAHEILKKNPQKYYMPNQFESQANILAHYKTTGPEIFKQTKGKIDYFVAGLGTTGTIMGTGKYLKKQNKKIKIIGIEPTKNHTIQGLKNMEESIVPGIYNLGMLDDKITVKDEEAFRVTKQLAQKEGLFVGMSSGAAVVGALKIAKKIKSGNIITILPDRGDRYLSTHLFKSFCAKCLP